LSGFEGFPPWIQRWIEELPEQRFQRVKEFVQEMRLAGRSERTIKRCLWAIRSLGNGGKPYEQLTKSDLLTWLESLEGNGYSERTIRDYKAGVKQFLRWVYGRNGFSKKAEQILSTIKVGPARKTLPKEILSPSEIRRMIEACDNPRDRALVHVLYESGARSGELLNMKIGDVEFDQYGAVVRVCGKTGPRRLRLIESVPDLQLWLSMHPKRSDREASLWFPTTPRTPKARENKLQLLLKRLAQKAGVRKRVHPHLFRHSRATHLANVLTEAQLRVYFGWTKDSEMPSIYVHLSGRDVDRSLLEHYGRKIDDGHDTPKELWPKKCPRCGLENPATGIYCTRCSCPLDERVAQELEEKRIVAEGIVAEVVQEIIKRAPELVEQILKERGLVQRLQEVSSIGSVSTPVRG
jgi:integrase